MNKRILLGIDATLSSSTRQALRKASEFIEEAVPQLHIILLHVIPVPSVISPTISIGMHTGQTLPVTATLEQREQAEKSLYKARAFLKEQGIASTQIEALIRVGSPADEIVKVARELNADFIIIGSRGDSLKQKIRRVLAGSISRQVLHFASCPVMIVVSPKTTPPGDLVSWYEQAVIRYLHEHRTLTVFTSREVAKQFAPPGKSKPGRKETAAAILALEHLSHSGVLCRHDIQGELRYVND